MNDTLHRHTRLAVDRRAVVGRRDFLRCITAGSLATGTLSWSDLMTLEAADLKRRGKACILLWMQGGPSQFETFDPKPGHANGGETKAIETSIAGIGLADNLPNLAKVMDHLAVVRSMTSREGSHPRARQLLHTGYLPTPTVKYPTLGSIASSEIANPDCQLPAFVQIGRGRSGGGGLLGREHDPFNLAQAGRTPSNARPTTNSGRFKRRLSLLDELEADYAASGGKQEVKDHKALYEKTARMLLSPDMKAFDLAGEPASLRAAYGDGSFASGCLIARRLIERGVTFVEITSGGWDTHQDNFTRTKQLSESIDQPFAQLVGDLSDRGLLEETLVIWMGEFGRTPRINARTGRDHYPRSFSLAMAGGGVRGGQVVGKTDTGGTRVTDREVTVPDLFCTICKSLGIDPTKENLSPIGRPIKIVDGGSPVDELFS